MIATLEHIFKNVTEFVWALNIFLHRYKCINSLKIFRITNYAFPINAFTSHVIVNMDINLRFFIVLKNVVHQIGVIRVGKILITIII